MKRAVFVAFVVGTAVGIASGPPSVRPVPVPAADHHSTALEEVRGRYNNAQLLLMDIGMRAGIVRPMWLTIGPCSDACVDIGEGSDTAYVMIDMRMLAAPPLVLEATLSHEVGHVAAGHIKKWKSQTTAAKDRFQDEADAYAMHLMGEPRYRQFLAVHDRDADRVERTIARLRLIPVNLPLTAGS